MPRTASIILSLSLASVAAAQSPWTREKGGGYFQLSAFTAEYDQLQCFLIPVGPEASIAIRHIECNAVQSDSDVTRRHAGLLRRTTVKNGLEDQAAS